MIEDNFRANFTVMPEFEERNNWLLGTLPCSSSFQQVLLIVI